MKQGWALKKMSEVCDFQNGFAFKSKTFKDSGTPLLRITNIQNEVIDTSNVVYIDPNDYERDLSRYKVVQGDLLIAMSGATTGKIGVHQSSDVLLLNQRVGKFKPKHGMLKSYLFYYLLTKVEESLSISEGAAQPNLSTEQIKSFQVPIPPLEEQKQIVAVLNKAFAAIDLAKANIEKNLQNAKELFQSKLNEIFTQKGEGWEERNIEDVTEVVTKGSSPKWQGINYVEEPGVLFITSENVGVGTMLMKKRKYLEERFNSIQRKSILKTGDVLTNIVGGSIGRTAVYNLDDLANINQAVCIMRCKETELYNFYLMYLLNSPYFKTILHDNEVDNARANLSLTFFKKLRIRLPSIQEQKNIVKEIEGLNHNTKLLIKVIENKLAGLVELKKSILQKAFAGELMK